VRKIGRRDPAVSNSECFRWIQIETNALRVGSTWAPARL